LATLLQWTVKEKYAKYFTIILRESTKRVTKDSCCTSVQTDIKNAKFKTGKTGKKKISDWENSIE